ncbi:MAG: hypothetical protein A3J79_01245 [Elusimicrobia bacterium RIFOXYB2_FULL_62_6]|nr:MAG: hypothetical protein A3J79_01245 [Elusimicrobia bacterium RIFOXYB2_FULL_62_6]
MYRILAIDDDPMMQQVLKATLQPEGYEFLVSPDGKAGLLKAAADKPDLIILDVNLPDMTGMDVCRALKAGQATKHIPVIMLTGEAREVVNRVEGLDTGAEDYLFKPVSPRLLVSRIKSLLKLTSKPTQR